MKIPFTALLLLASSAQAVEYQLMIDEHPTEIAKRPNAAAAGQVYWARYGAHGQALQAAGVLRGGGALEPAAAGRSVRWAGGRQTVAAVPDSPAGTQLGGWFVIDLASLDSALEWAAKAPSADTGGSVEVRRLATAPTMTR